MDEIMDELYDMGIDSDRCEIDCTSSGIDYAKMIMKRNKI